MSKLSFRLNYALSLKKGNVFLDVGSDHALLALALEEEGKVYASENKIGPYSTLVNTLKRNGSNVIPLFLDGIKDIPDDIECVYILGMGGRTIEKILIEGEEKLKKIKYLIISPQSDFYLPITFLYNHGFIDDAGTYIFEKHYYPVLRFSHYDKRIVYNDDESKYSISAIKNRDVGLKNLLLTKLALFEKIGDDKENEIIELRRLLKLWN